MIVCICKNINTEQARNILATTPFWGNYVDQNCVKCGKEFQRLQKERKEGL